MSSWSEYFADVPDPRRSGGHFKHLLSDILGLSLCAMLCGADDFGEMALFCQQRQEFLKEKLGFVLPHGVPSHDTFNRVFALLEPDTLETCLLGWVHEWQESQGRRHVCVDGKVARGSWEHQGNVCALTTVSVFASELRLTLCCSRLEGQGGENLLAPGLLALLDLEGAVVTGDAAYCQKAVARAVEEAKGDYVLVLKTNHRLLYEQVQHAFPVDAPAHQVQEEGHGRKEARRVQCISVEELGLEEKDVQEWPGLASVVRVERTRLITTGQKAGKSSQSVWFYLSSLPVDAPLLGHTIRSHWTIENQSHWVLDVVFGEDRCRTRKQHAPYNLALLRRICLNLLRQNQGKNSLKATRKAVTWNQDLLLKILQTSLCLF